MSNAHEDFEHPAVSEGHPLRLHCLYRIERSQWSDRQAPGTLRTRFRAQSDPDQ
jgi:hypothetical protein